MNDYLLRAGLDCAAGLTGFGATWLLQSSLLLGGGLIIGWLLRRRGPAVQSVIYCATLVAVIACPIATWASHQIGVPGWSANLPAPWTLSEPVLTVTSDVRQPAPDADQNRPSVPPMEYSAQPFPVSPVNTSLSNESHPTKNTTAQKETAESISDFSSHPRPEAIQSDPSLSQSLPSTLIVQRFGVIASLLCLVWFAGTATLLARITWAWRRLERLRRSVVEAAPETIGTCREVASLMAINSPGVKHTLSALPLPGGHTPSRRAPAGCSHAHAGS